MESILGFIAYLTGDASPPNLLIDVVDFFTASYLMLSYFDADRSPALVDYFFKEGGIGDPRLLFSLDGSKNPASSMQSFKSSMFCFEDMI